MFARISEILLKTTKFPVFPTKNKSYVDLTELSFVH